MAGYINGKERRGRVVDDAGETDEGEEKVGMDDRSSLRERERVKRRVTSER